MNYHKLKREVGADKLGKLWILAHDVFGPGFTEEQALSLAPIARRTPHPRTNLAVNTDHIYQEEGGSYRLVPHKPLKDATK